MAEYSKREKKEFNKARAIFQWLTVKVAYGFWYRNFHGLKVYGKENVPKGEFVIVASNHISAVDPFLVIDAIEHPAAYMAKKELFEKPVSRFFMNVLGAFAIDRDKLAVSTIKTAKIVKETGWFLALFPQGTREADDNFENVAVGFCKMAKMLKCGILPIGIIGTQKENRRKFKSKMAIKIGKVIPYMEDSEEMKRVWIEKIKELIKDE